ncbi:MAG TPA: cytosine permease [Thermoplasmata archaeon]|nr:cytosine permease [Thermoplasmata archaeon]
MAGEVAPGTGAAYGAETLKVEPFGIERIEDAERHGRPWKLLPFWFGANVSLFSFGVGFLGIAVLSLPVPLAIAGVVLGTVLGCLPFALLGILGPATGYPQIAQSRSVFGRRGAYVPAALNWFSTTGWSSVTFILGALALTQVTPLPYVGAVVVFAAIQVLIALYGHNLLHRFEQVMALILAGVFVAMTVSAVSAGAGTYAPSGGGAAGVAFMAILAASIPISWAPYASDFSRYLEKSTPKKHVFLPAFLGMGIACVWVEILGVLVSARLSTVSNPVAVFTSAFGPAYVGLLALLLAVNLLAANAPNLYSSGLSLLALDVPVKRWSSVLVGGGLAVVLAAWGGASAVAFYQGWLFFVEYWIAPWAAIVLVSFFVFRPRGAEPAPDHANAWNVPALAAYGVAVLAAIPFMDRAPTFVGPVSAALGGLDLSNLVSFGLAGALFYALRTVQLNRAAAFRDAVAASRP